jgi:hypothetical protein
MSAVDPELPLGNGGFGEANYGVTLRYSGRFIFRRNAL